MPVLSTVFEPATPALPQPLIAKTESSSSSKSCKRKGGVCACPVPVERGRVGVEASVSRGKSVLSKKRKC